MKHRLQELKGNNKWGVHKHDYVTGFRGLMLGADVGVSTTVQRSETLFAGGGMWGG